MQIPSVMRNPNADHALQSMVDLLETEEEFNPAVPHLLLWFDLLQQLIFKVSFTFPHKGQCNYTRVIKCWHPPNTQQMSKTAKCLAEMGLNRQITHNMVSGIYTTCSRGEVEYVCDTQTPPPPP